LRSIAIDIQVVAQTRTGVGQFTYHLVKTLLQVDDANHYTLFLFDFRRRFRGFSSERKNVSLKKVRLPGIFVRKLWDLIAYPPVEMMTGRFDLFHFTNYMIPPMRENRALTTIYDMGFWRFPQYAAPAALKWPLRHVKESAEKALGVITVSEFSKSEIVNLLGLPSEKVHVVYPGVSSTFREDTNEAESSHVRAKYRISAPYVLSVGTLEPRKNLPALLKAYQKNVSFFRNSGCKLLLVGMKGWLYDEVFRTVQKYALENDVLFTGYVEEHELVPIYRDAEFAVFPSLYEGFGMPLLEAMASKTPVLASNIAAHREILRDAALFFDPEDIDGLGRLMRELSEDHALRRNLTEKASRRALRFTWEASAAELARIYGLAADRLT